MDRRTVGPPFLTGCDSSLVAAVALVAVDILEEEEEDLRSVLEFVCRTGTLFFFFGGSLTCRCSPASEIAGCGDSGKPNGTYQLVV